MEEYNLTLWEIFKNCYTGGYIGGEAFESENGKVIYFNGNSLSFIEGLNVKEKFKYLGGF